MNHSECVKEFTDGYSGKNCPERPVEMNRDQVLFSIRMVMSEMHELACTVSETPEHATELMQTALGSMDLCKNCTYTPVSRIAAQADSFVDAWYYMLNSACKAGMNLDPIFKTVHNANMDKRDPETNTFLRREDGKVIKRPGWTEPDIQAIIQDQLEHGSWKK